jgi:predicted RNA binding protein YcfA (HicA-like mRNA interferase family)
VTGAAHYHVAVFPSVKARRLLAVLQRAPLEYEVVSQRGSHRVLESRAGYPRLRFSFHDRVELGPTIVRKILVGDVGLSEEEALALL